MEILDTRGSQALGGEPRVELLGPKDLDTAGSEGAADKRPVRFDEAEDAGYGDLVADGRSDYVDLLEDAVDELGLVAGADQEFLDAGGKMPPSTLSDGRPLYFLASMT